jgi:hypothetical protein
MYFTSLFSQYFKILSVFNTFVYAIKTCYYFNKGSGWESIKKYLTQGGCNFRIGIP